MSNNNQKATLDCAVNGVAAHGDFTINKGTEITGTLQFTVADATQNGIQSCRTVLQTGDKTSCDLDFKSNADGTNDLTVCGYSAADFVKTVAGGSCQ